MNGRVSRNVRLWGEEGQEAIARMRVAVFGLGGVGSYAAEALARSGVGALLLVDGDCVDDSNINRQLVADITTVGRPKAEVMRDRVLRVQPDCRVTALHLFYDEATADSVDFSQYDYVVDAIDALQSKVLLLQAARRAGCAVVSAMGAGNKLDPTRFEIARLSQTSVCPLARAMRRLLKQAGEGDLTVVYSREEPAVKAVPPGSAPFVPGAMGLALASAVVRDALGLYKILR